MLVLNTGDVRLDMDLFHIVFLLNEDDRYRYIAEIDRLNNEKMFTLGLYEYRIETIRGRANEKIPLESLRDAIESHNIVIRLMDDVEGNHYYVFDTIDPSLSLPDWRRSMHSFIIEVSKINCRIIEGCIAAERELKKEGYEKSISDYQECIDSLNTRVANAVEEYQNYVKQNAPQIRICKIETTHYRKVSQRYGILVTIGDKSIPVFFKNIDQKMLYIAALLRYKSGQPLFLHELFNNSRCAQNRTSEQKRAFKQWIKSLYRIIVDMDNRNVDAWLKKIEVKGRFEKRKSQSDKSQVEKNINPLYQAKSDANRCVKQALKFYNASLSYCLLQTNYTSDKDSYYTFAIPVENISVDESLQELIYK
jgi:hypothetical protein